MSASPPSIRRSSRRGRKLAAGGAGVALVLASLFIDWRPERPETEPRLIQAESRSGILLAGAGKAEVRLPHGVPLAGYRPFGRKAMEAGTPLHVRSLLLEAGGMRTAIVATELMTLPDSLALRLSERIRAEGAGCGIVAATHTHSGPGSYDRALLPQAVAVGLFDEEVEKAILEAASASLAAARAELAPATLSIAESAIGLNGNRDSAGARADDRLTEIRLERSDGSRLARIVRFAAHPTLTPRGIGPGGDWPGAAMDLLEEDGGIAIVLQGAVGDARVAKGAVDSSQESPASAYAALLLEQVEILSHAEAAEDLRLGCAEVEIDLPPASLHAMVPWPLGMPVSNLLSLAAPATARLAALRLDEFVLLALPAEPTFAAALAGEASAEAAGLRGRTVSLAQGYVGYAPLPADVEARVFSSRYSWFGPELAARLAAGERVAVDALSPRSALDFDSAGGSSDRADDSLKSNGSAERPEH